MYVFLDKFEEKGVIERKGEKDGRIGIYMVNFSLISKIVKGVEEAKKQKYHSYLYPTPQKPILPQKNLSLSYITKRKIDRFLVLSSLSPGDIRIFIEEKIPPVAVYNGYPNKEVSSIMFDFRRGTRCFKIYKGKKYSNYEGRLVLFRIDKNGGEKWRREKRKERNWKGGAL